MRSKLYTNTKPTIISTRISDDQMESVRQLMEVTHMSASEIMRSAIHLQIERFYEAGAGRNSGL